MPRMILTASGRLGTLLAGYHLGVELKRKSRNVLWVMGYDVPLAIKSEELKTALFDVKISVRSNGQMLPDNGCACVLVANEIPVGFTPEILVIECRTEDLGKSVLWKWGEQVVIIVREGETIDPQFLHIQRAETGCDVIPLQDYLRWGAPARANTS